jgi:NADPH:quinone reductase-like Zn-dependent oxidoreductase
MQAYAICDEFGLDNLVVVDRPDVRPAPGEVVVDLKAASPNYRDLLMIEGKYNPRQPLPLIPVSDAAGVVAGVGDGVERVELGDRVMPIFAQGWLSGRPSRAKFKTTLGGPRDGVLAETIVVDQEGLVRVPEHLSFEEAATLPCAALTAWNALFEHGSAKAGDVVVCQGTGGVSTFALQFAHMMGCEPIVTSSSDAKLERARQMGAAHTINYRKEKQWGRVVRELTDGRGADHIIEVGGAGTLQQSLKAARYGGHISVIGVLSGVAQELNVIPILMHNICVQGIFVGSREMLQNMVRAIEVNQMRPVVDRVFEFDQAREALDYMKSGAHLGKVVVEIG